METQDKYSVFDVLINCAWVFDMSDQWEISYMKAEYLMKVNVIAPIMLTDWLATLLKKNESDIVNIWSTIWFKSYESQCLYGVSKRWMRWFSKNLQWEFKNSWCRVISFNPWWFQSDFFSKATGKDKDVSNYMDPKKLAELIKNIIALPKNIEVSEVVINRK